MPYLNVSVYMAVFHCKTRFYKLTDTVKLIFVGSKFIIRTTEDIKHVRDELSYAEKPM